MPNRIECLIHMKNFIKQKKGLLSHYKMFPLHICIMQQHSYLFHKQVKALLRYIRCNHFQYYYKFGEPGR
ncbi:hypothetical protein DXA38_09465 [[Clostridium] innocuum]|uniref:Uncharacterized protein n=1 Tax=Clostridium innocuum TaxID=1522 RepID=A0A3E2VX10_CLOIN|nr:hypothetical protein DXA38_09465 [[Clostridium] innocuum]RHV61182.1 hypothetical protein DXB22_17795 [Clostridiaceae bacterium OM02-2AC]